MSETDFSSSTEFLILEVDYYRGMLTAVTYLLTKSLLWNCLPLRLQY